MMNCSTAMRPALAAATATLFLASGAAAGPVMLIGDAADSHGAQNVYAGLVHETLSNVTNGQNGILALGVDPGSDAANWLLGVSALLPQPQLVAFVNDETVGVIGLSGYGLVYVPSPSTYTAGGITPAENDLLNTRAADVASFLDNGGGLVALTQGDLQNPYGFLGDFAPVGTIAVGPSGICGEENAFNDVTPTAAGSLFGITGTNLDGCCWGNVFAVAPEELTALATATEPGCPTIDGIASILVGFVDIPEVGFDPPNITPAAGEPNIQAVGDLDGDGTPDVVAVIPDPDPALPGAIQVFLNQGGDWNGLLANTPIPVGNNPRSVAVGLFNNDADLDLAVANRNDNTVSIFFNNALGDGTFSFEGNVAVGNEPVALATADFTEDGFVDIAVALAGDEEVVILANDGSGNFGLPESALVPLGMSPSQLLFGDFDGNKCPDLTGPGSDDAAGIAGATVGRVFVLLGQGGGTFGPPTLYDVGLNPVDIAIGDLNGDGFPDLATSDMDDDTVSILLNLQNGTFAPSISVDVGDAPSSVDIVDVNVDARPDVTVAADDQQIGPAVQVLENLTGVAEGTVSFSKPIGFDVSGDPNFVANGDFNLDGLPDLVAVNDDTGGAGSVVVLLNNPPAAPCIGDFNGDGYVNVIDMLELLANWGPCSSGTSCEWDLNGDEEVGILDFLALFQTWGICDATGCPWDLNGDGFVTGLDVAELLQNLGDCEDPDNCPADLDGDGTVGLLDLWTVLLHIGDCG